MKEVCERTGLTDRAVRLYIDSGLVDPKRESSYTGRSAIYFEEADIETLQMVAVLRKAGFSIADIKKMLMFPKEIPAVIRTHRAAIEEEIAQKQAVLKNLSSFSDSSFESCYALAAAISKSSPGISIPKEDIYMNFDEIKKMIRGRLPSIFAFGALLIGMLTFITLGIKTAFLNFTIANGGGYDTNYALIFSGFKSALALTPAVLAVFAAGFMIPRLAGGKRKWLIISLSFCVLSAVTMLLLPDDVSSRMYLHEFLAYRYSFMNSIFHVAHKGIDFFIASLKFIPHLVATILIAVALTRENDFFE